MSVLHSSQLDMRTRQEESLRAASAAGDLADGGADDAAGSGAPALTLGDEDDSDLRELMLERQQQRQRAASSLEASCRAAARTASRCG
jgi:hypothetical protein